MAGRKFKMAAKIDIFCSLGYIFKQSVLFLTYNLLIMNLCNICTFEA